MLTMRCWQWIVIAVWKVSVYVYLTRLYEHVFFFFFQNRHLKCCFQFVCIEMKCINLSILLIHTHLHALCATTHTHTHNLSQTWEKDVPLMWGYLQLRLMSTAESSAYSSLTHTHTQMCSSQSENAFVTHMVSVGGCVFMW